MKRQLHNFADWILILVFFFSVSILVPKGYWLGASVVGTLIWIRVVLSIWQKEKGWAALFLTIYMTVTYGIVLWLFPLGIVDPVWVFILAFLTLIVVLWWNLRAKRN